MDQQQQQGGIVSDAEILEDPERDQLIVDSGQEVNRQQPNGVAGAAAAIPPSIPFQQPSHGTPQFASNAWQQHAPSLLQFYEDQMRAAAGNYAAAAYAAAQIAADIAASSSATNSTSNTGGGQISPRLPMFPTSLPILPPHPQNPPSPHQNNMMYGTQQHHPFPPHPQATASIGGPAQQSYFFDSSTADMYPSGGEDYNMMMYDTNQDDSSFRTENTDESHYGSRHHRRKRQQRMPPPPHSHQQHQPYGFAAAAPQQHQQNQNNNNNSSSNNNNNEKRGRRRRRFRNNDGSSGDEYRRPRVHRKMTFSSNSDGGGNGSASSSSKVSKKKQRQPNDESLLGKTGVSALYEWCGKRRTNPIFSLQNEQIAMPAGVSPAGVSLLTGTTTLNSNSNVVEQQEPSPQVIQSTSFLPQHQDDFEMSVSVDGMECGRGRGRTKAAAKQMCARRALQVLLPGVVFEEASGILIELPRQQQQKWPTENQINNSHQQSISRNAAISNVANSNNNTVLSSLEDLAPNLAKRLAIGHPNDDDNNNSDQEGGGRNGQESQKKSGGTRSALRSALPSVYPGTSTTSDDEDENAYYASRGASICSALLHAMVQIDDRIPEAPSYTYQVSTVPLSTSTAITATVSSSSQLKRKAGGPSAAAPSPSHSPIVIHRGSFTCVATMRLLAQNPNNPAVKTYEILQDKGIGCTKREARHTASARLLALLFPECDDLVQVKEAAEAARERYAASRALKQKSKREAKQNFVSGRSYHETKYGVWENILENIVEPPPANLAFAMPVATKDTSTAGKKDRILSTPEEIKEHILNAIDPVEIASGGDGREFKSDTAPDEKEASAALARQLSRRKQLDDRITAALQKLNEHDEEGRSLPDELTADDVGRTVLRKASPEDLDWIAKLLNKSESSKASTPSPISIIGPTVAATTTVAAAKAASSSTLHSPTDPSKDVCHSQAVRLWSSSTIVLLLCRAIAPFEDPPLGCAALTLGFSMEKGKELRIAQLASKPHLPRERFIECLQSFARCLGCTLETTPARIPSQFKQLGQRECKKIVSSHLCVSIREDDESMNANTNKPMATTNQDQHQQYRHRPCEEPLVVASSALQSVQEENEDIEESDSCPEHTIEGQDKPSKRSRVQ